MINYKFKSVKTNNELVRSSVIWSLEIIFNGFIGIFEFIVYHCFRIRHRVIINYDFEDIQR